MTLRFGTDGIRGLANQELTVELSLALGRAAALVIGGGKRFLVGRDTRRSGTSLQAALSAGLTAVGTDVVDLGVLPTPGVAYLSKQFDCPAAMISASHNPFQDNGIKFFQTGGKKLADDVEEALEAELRRLLASSGDSGAVVSPTGVGVGVVSSESTAVDGYIDHLVESYEGNGSTLDGLVLVLDCANGAASRVAPEVFRRLGASVTVLADMPDGQNINEQCGSTHPGQLQRAVIEQSADLGLAFDGDADRVLAVDEKGQLIDGDQMLAVLALEAKTNGTLKDNVVVVTVMSNLGFRLAMERNGIEVHQTKVGDRYVLEALDDGEWSLGGEQSGHIILPRFATTGDGVLAGLRFIRSLRFQGKPASEVVAASMSKLPQVLRNVKVDRAAVLDDCEPVWHAVREVEQALGNDGRVLLRASGTEPLVRVMVEAVTDERAHAVCDQLCGVVERELGLGR